MIGERIRAARKAQSLSLRALAQRVGLSHEMVRRYERGEVVPNTAALLKIADALGRTPDYFLRPQQVGAITPVFCTTRKMPARQRSLLYAQVQDWLERCLAIEQILGITMRFNFPESFPRAVHTLDEAEQAALDLRDAWSLGLDPLANLTETLEERGIRVGAIQSLEVFDGCAFEVLVDESRQPLLVYAAGASGDRQRFSLAQALGRLMLRGENGLDEEKVANRFAGAFLAPAPSVRREVVAMDSWLTLSELHFLKWKYGMSMHAWIDRLRDLGYLSNESAAREFRRFRTKGWRTEEPGEPYPPEKPRRFENLVLAAYEEELITASRASELLNLPYSEFVNRYMHLQGGAAIALCRGHQRLD